MELTPEQRAQVERLYENESLTSNLTDDSARALLKWAEQQIVSNTDAELVVTAVNAANASGATGSQEVVAQAGQVLTRELALRAEQEPPAVAVTLPAVSVTEQAAPAAKKPRKKRRKQKRKTS